MVLTKVSRLIVLILLILPLKELLALKQKLASSSEELVESDCLLRLKGLAIPLLQPNLLQKIPKGSGVDLGKAFFIQKSPKDDRLREMIRQYVDDTVLVLPDEQSSAVIEEIKMGSARKIRNIVRRIAASKDPRIEPIIDVLMMDFEIVLKMKKRFRVFYIKHLSKGRFLNSKSILLGEGLSIYDLENDEIVTIHALSSLKTDSSEGP